MPEIERFLTAKPPKTKPQKVWVNSQGWVTTRLRDFHCPNCDHSVGAEGMMFVDGVMKPGQSAHRLYISDMCNYCPECGQKIDWDNIWDRSDDDGLDGNGT